MAEGQGKALGGNLLVHFDSDVVRVETTTMVNLAVRNGGSWENVDTFMTSTGPVLSRLEGVDLSVLIRITIAHPSRLIQPLEVHVSYPSLPCMW